MQGLEGALIRRSHKLPLVGVRLILRMPIVLHLTMCVVANADDQHAWLREREVSWWDSQAQLVQDEADQGDAFGVFATFKELRIRGATVHLGEVRPADVDAERDAWAGEGEGLVSDRVWDNIPSYSPMDVVWGNAPAPNELHAALRQMSLARLLEKMRSPLNF